MIDRTTVDRIIETARIVEVVSDFVSLKRNGSNYKGCCPFHNERTPSFSVSPVKNIFKCFGCGEAGNPVNFIMKHEKLAYPDALRYLAKKYGIPIEEREQTPEDKQLSDRRESLMVLSAYAARVFHDQLFNTLEGKAIGLSYFKERGLREDMIKTFELGYSFEARNAFTQKALKDGYKEEILVETGLSIKSEHGVFDRFSGRVMFPIHSLSGKVIAFGGRILKVDKAPAKYLNSPESEIYHKSKVLYGIYQAKKSIGQKDKCILVEGYTDVLSMHQAGIEHVVASTGTALTVEQIQLVKRFTPNVTVLYDGDPPGIKASLRAIDLILQEDMNVKLLLLPDGEDPDSFARSHSSSELEEYIRDNEMDFITFKQQTLPSDAKNDPIKRAQLITEVIQSIALIPKPITRSVYLKECARIFEMDERILAETEEKFRQKKVSSLKYEVSGYGEQSGEKEISNHKPQTLDLQPDAYNLQLPTSNLKLPTKNPELEKAELEIIRLMLRYGQETLIGADEITGEARETVSGFIIRELCTDELDLQQPLLRRIFEEYRQLVQNGSFFSDMYFLQHPDPEVSRLAAGFEPKYELSKIHSRNGSVIKTEENNLLELVPEGVLIYKKSLLMNRLNEVSLAIQQAENNKDIGLLETLFTQYGELTQIKKALGLTLGGRVYQ